MSLDYSDELVPGQGSRGTASIHSSFRQKKLIVSRIVQDTFNAHAVVSIGASSDEEEIALPAVPMNGNRTCDCVAENRNDEESYSNSREIKEIRTDGLMSDRGAKDSRKDDEFYNVSDGNSICGLQSAAWETLYDGQSKNEMMKGKYKDHRGADTCMLEIGVEILDPENKCYIPIGELQNNTTSTKHRGSCVKFGSNTIQDNSYFDNRRSRTTEPVSEANVSEQSLVTDCLVENRTDDQKSVLTRPLDIILAGSKMVFETRDQVSEKDGIKKKENESNFPPCNVKYTSKNIERSRTASRDRESASRKDGTLDKSTFQSPLSSILRTFPVLHPATSRHPRLRFFQGRGKDVSSPKAKPFPCFRGEPVVKFSAITIRTYPIILGDHPSCKFGAPISIGWDYHECQSIPVDIYENNRSERKRMKQLYLNSGCRRMILTGAGFSLEQISEAINDVQMIQLQRKESTNDQVGILSLFRGVTNFTMNEQPGDCINMKGWNKNKTSLWSRVLEQCPSGKFKSRRAKF
ncbi:hypothetical protein ACHAW6_006203 [Cyclotella cf. meneghiniana]